MVKSNYPFILQRLRDLRMSRQELGEYLGIAKSTLTEKLISNCAWTEPQMQMVLEYIGKPEETLADFFPRRKI